MTIKYLSKKGYFDFLNNPVKKESGGICILISVLIIILFALSFFQLSVEYYLFNLLYYVLIFLISIVINILFFSDQNIYNKIIYTYISKSLFIFTFASFLTEFSQFLTSYEYFLNNILLIYIINKFLPAIIGYIVFYIIVLFDKKLNIIIYLNDLKIRNKILEKYIPTLFALCVVIYYFNGTNYYINILSLPITFLIHATFGLMATCLIQYCVYIKKYLMVKSGV
jgi:hypothetical protein